MNRRKFVLQIFLGSVGLTAGIHSLEEQVLMARKINMTSNTVNDQYTRELPKGRIGSLRVSRLICGGNLISGIAHSRDLEYVSSLLKQYFTDEKVFETFQVCEEMGVNTAILRLDDHTLRILDRYWNQVGGEMQWIVQIKPKQRNLRHFEDDINRALDNGAVGAYIQGGIADQLTNKGEVQLVGQAMEKIQEKGVPAGIGAHSIETIKACAQLGFVPDFYMKTLHPNSYWTFNPGNEQWKQFHVTSDKSHDNVWSISQEETIDFMNSIQIPWVGFKVMAAGGVPPKEGFRYAYANGVDFICAGMFDFQVREDVIIARDLLTGTLKRSRPWYG